MTKPFPLPDKDAWIAWVLRRMRWIAAGWPPREDGPDAAKEIKE